MSAIETESPAGELLATVRELLPGFRQRAGEAEELRTLPTESVDELLASEIAATLVPRRWGGLELGLDTWVEIAREVASADASHGWCAELLVHLSHIVSYFPEEGQAAVWADGANVPVSGSVLPVCEVEVDGDGYRVSGRSPFSSGVNHSTWVFVGGMVPTEDGPAWHFFLIPPGEYTVVDTWQVMGMRGTGSNTIVTDGVSVPAEYTLALADLLAGTGPGSRLHANPLYSLPFMSYAPIGFAATMLGAAEGALHDFTAATRERRTAAGLRMAEIASIQSRLARTAAGLDGAELLLGRAVAATGGETPPSLETRGRTMRDCSLASELVVGAIDELLALSGTAGFAAASPLQRAWRDVHFAASHASLNPEANFANWGRLELGVERAPELAMY